MAFAIMYAINAPVCYIGPRDIRLVNYKRTNLFYNYQVSHNRAVITNKSINNLHYGKKH